MELQDYDAERHLADVERVWREVGWVDDDDAEHLGPFLAEASATVAVLDGAAEACASVHRGRLLHTRTDLDAAVVSSVTVSRIGRRQGLAGGVLTRELELAARDGAALAILGMFDQGFYDRFGFGTGAEMLFHRLDPASLSPDLPHRPPVRLTLDDADEMVAALLARSRGHGGVALPSVGMRRAEYAWSEKGFGLGYRDEDGTLTHFLWASGTGEAGPYRVQSWAWRTPQQLRELLGVLRSLGDQVRWVRIPEPWSAQLQVLTTHPARQYQLTKGTPNAYVVDADAWWQARILDLPSCVAAVEAVRPLRCNLRLTDPLAGAIDGVAGDWVLDLGATSTVRRGHDPELPLLSADVGAFTRLWLGVRPATSLATTDALEGSAGLLEAFDDALRLPRPDPSHDF